VPVWLQVLGGLITICVGLGALWKTVLKPGARLISNTERMIPLLNVLVVEFADAPNLVAVLKNMANEFKADSGSTLRDVVNRLEDAAEVNKAAGELLKVGVEAAKQLAEQDRQQLQRAIILLDRLTIRVDAAAVTGQRMEAAASGVADNLAASHARAAASSGDPGAAADAASRSPDQTGHP